MEHYLTIKRMNYWYLEQLGWSSSAFCWMKKKKLIWKVHILYVSIYITFAKWYNYRDGRQISDCQELAIVGGLVWHCVGDLYDDGRMLYFHCNGSIKCTQEAMCCDKSQGKPHTHTVNFTFPVPILHSTYVGSKYWWNWVKSARGPLCTIFATCSEYDYYKI